MEERLASYRALDSASSRSSVNAVLTAVVSASPVSWTSGVRRDFVQVLLDDVDAAGSKARLSLKELPLALLAIKTIGRQPEASAIIVVESNLLILFKIASSLGKHPNEVVNEALKCTANALLLQENGRDNWIALGGGDLCLSILQKELTAEQVFLVSRILFLITLRQSPFMRKAIEELQLVDSISAKLDFSLSVLLAEQPYGKEAMVDLLKVAFNLITQYPRIVASSLPSAGGTGSGLSESAQLGELWNDKLEGFVDPLLRLLHLIPLMSPSPLQPPLTHVFHALINVPVSGIYITKWFAASYSLPSSPIASPRVSPVDTIHRAFSRFSIGGNSSSRRSMSSNRSASRPATPFASETQGASQGFVDTIQKLFDLFSDTLTYYVSYDPDDVAVRDKCRQEGVVLDELVVPLPIILSRLAKGDETARSRLREFMLPVDLDRTTPLEKRHDILGICIRIMTCVHHPHLKETVGDFIFSICDSDPSTLATQIGYGNAAGFLFSKGIMAPPTEAFDSSGVRLNPITGTTAALQPSTDDMTQEEKEAEAERLFVLFDRLERSGMGVNPIRRAQQEGRFENI